MDEMEVEKWVAKFFAMQADLAKAKTDITQNALFNLR